MVSHKRQGLRVSFLFLDSNKLIPELNIIKLDNKMHISTSGVSGKFSEILQKPFLSVGRWWCRGGPLGPGQPPLYTH